MLIFPPLPRSKRFPVLQTPNFILAPSPTLQRMVQMVIWLLFALAILLFSVQSSLLGKCILFTFGIAAAMVGISPYLRHEWTELAADSRGIFFRILKNNWLFDYKNFDSYVFVPWASIGKIYPSTDSDLSPIPAIEVKVDENTWSMLCPNENKLPSWAQFAKVKVNAGGFRVLEISAQGRAVSQTIAALEQLRGMIK
jgi:hypothetical protein